ncbi:hypothetical protein [Apibacter sp. HY039]|uniref:hypothetical protein n=1 Tax=Apibacter sp. HY039 TaxID=2501476 RepID=UPI0013E3554D|nr:hypothetical protein [Apibacter sp. HY039]
MFMFVGLIFHAQDIDWKNSNFRIKTLQIQDSLIVLDTLSIIPGQINIKDSLGQAVLPNLYKFDSSANLLKVDHSLLNQTLTIGYYIFPVKKENIVYSKDTNLIVTLNKPRKLYEITAERKKKNDFFQGLTSSGSMVRGITFGNNQSASVQSSLDLELSGQLSKDIRIKAAISDHNIPIQSDGYTQRLDEFDKIYIELSNKASYIRAGHLDLVQSSDYFANFSRKITGIQIGTRLEHKNSYTDLYAVGSLSRGEFNRMQFNGVEGNQGPYKLKGKQGELFIIVISGSEKVYINGALLVRGEDKDYIINYNTGELTFTSRSYIAASSRIVVEYIYNTTTYNRFLFYAGGKYESERFSFNAHIFSETDGKNSNQDLTDAQKIVLSQAGNDQDRMFAVNEVITDYDPNKILYKKIDWEGISIYEYSTDSSEILYTLSFSYMGANKGNYRIVQLPVNGRVYEYIPPVNNVLQGDYEPVTKLIPPQKTQIFSSNSEYRFENGKVGVNLAISNRDENTFSSIGNSENIGFASRLYIDKKITRERWKSELHLEHAFLQKNFYILERINNVEFGRDFNISQEFNNRNQNKFRLDWKNVIHKRWTINYTLNYLEEQNFYKGYKNDLFAEFKSNSTHIFTQWSYLHTTAKDSLKSDYVKHASEINKRFNIFKSGLGFKGEHNQIKDKITSQYSRASFSWRELYVYGSLDSVRMVTQLKLYMRSDDSVRIGNMKNFTNTYGVVLNTQLIKTGNHSLSVEAHYRKVHYNKDIYQNQKDENYALGAIRWNKLFLNNGIILNALYELSSGQEAQREFKYVKVTDGQGIYKWTDYNQNGIEELDEFEIAEFSDQAQYIRVYTDNIKYQKSNRNRLNFTLQLNPSRFMKALWWERVNFQSSFQSYSTFWKKNKTAELNPFSDKELLTQVRSVTGNLSFNRLSIHKWTGVLQFIKSDNTQYVYTGKETRDNRNYQVLINYKPWNSWIFGLRNNFMNDKSYSQLFSTKRFTIESYGIHPSVTYEIQKNISASAFFKYQNKKNRTGDEKLIWKQAGIELRWNDERKTSLNGTFSYIQNDLTGNNYSMVANQMMEGLLDGKNMVWKAYIQRELSATFTLNVIYDGRKNEKSKTIHTGSVQLRANF